MGDFVEGYWRWQIHEELNGHNDGLLKELLALLEILSQACPIATGVEDSFRWCTNIVSQYAVREGYKAAANLGGSVAQSIVQKEAFSALL
ncbi:unnamed protein product [Vicia faba]|uniref:Uncharacterized protein n=1 Tax=Vicia faba TaxID=3906 RepID=A0AAV1AGV4_VICFA|nr:unnamed protein product [Vicia faba]